MIQTPIHTLPDQVDWLKLTTRIAAGDEESFAFFYHHFFERLFRYVLVMTGGDEQLSREVLQSTMVKAARYLKPLAEEVVLWSWLTQLAKTAFIDLLRRSQRAPPFVSLEVLNDTNLASDNPSHPDAVLEAALQNALELLPFEEQQLLRWTYFEDLSQKEIAASIQSTPKAVESKLARIRQKLRKILTTVLTNENRT
jgi:RNA polymerase sigma factor (sigma-70 family)